MENFHFLNLPTYLRRGTICLRFSIFVLSSLPGGDVIERVGKTMVKATAATTTTTAAAAAAAAEAAAAAAVSLLFAIKHVTSVGRA